MVESSQKQLYIIGNGFDLAHGVQSSYYAFREYLAKHNQLLSLELDTYFECDNFWGDFENNLAFLSRERVMESVDTMLDVYMETMDEDDDDFSYADYFAAIEMGTQVIPDVTEHLPQQFKRWINTLKPINAKNVVCERLLNNDALFLNFNYTEFLETLYSISKKKILYIHGDRRNRKEPLILGHGRDIEVDFLNWYEHKKQQHRFKINRSKKSGKDKNDNLTYLTYFLEDEQEGNWRNPIRYYAADAASGIIEGYFTDTVKQTEEIIRSNQLFFKALANLSEVTVIGHSLAPVDHLYFKEIIRLNHNPKQLRWKFSWYSDADKERIQRFSNILSISKQNVELFRLE